MSDKDITEALESLLKALERHRLQFLFCAVPVRTNPDNPNNPLAFLGINKEQILDPSELLHFDTDELPNENEDIATFLFKYQQRIEDYAKRVFSKFGLGKGAVPKVYKNGKYVEVEGGSLPWWELPKDSPFQELADSSKAIYDACKRLCTADTEQHYSELAKQAMNLAYDNKRCHWYSFKTVRWEYVEELDKIITEVTQARTLSLSPQPSNVAENDAQVTKPKKFGRGELNEAVKRILEIHPNMTAKKIVKQLETSSEPAIRQTEAWKKLRGKKK